MPSFHDRQSRFHVQPLEGRSLLTFSAHLDASIPDDVFAVFTGSAADESIHISASGGFLTHDRTTDSGFVSKFDFDSAKAGEQRLASGSRLKIDARGGKDLITISELSINDAIGHVAVSGGAG